MPLSDEGRTKVTDPFEKKFLRILKRHLSRDFPNPKRIGCPPKQQLMKLAAMPQSVRDWVVEHLLICSPCYRAYSKILRKQKTKDAGRKKAAKSRRAAAGS